MDSQAYPSQPSYVHVMWLLLACQQWTEFLYVDCVEKNLGIASAGAAGLKELVRVLQAAMQACPFWDFAIPWGRNGSTELNGFHLAARTQLLRWLSESDDILLLAGSPAAMQVGLREGSPSWKKRWYSNTFQIEAEERAAPAGRKDDIPYSWTVCDDRAVTVNNGRLHG